MRMPRSGKNYNIKDKQNARDIALFVLIEICENSRKSNTILKECFDDIKHGGVMLSSTDRAFIEHIVMGTLDRLITLDAVLSRFLTKPMKSQKPLIRAVLRMSLYQIMFMNRVPNSAACNEAVKLVKLHGMDGMSGFVNGVLRAAARDFEADGAKTDIEGKDTVKYSLPAWICNLLEKDYGRETAIRIFEAYLCGRKESVRFNLSRAALGGKTRENKQELEKYIVEMLKEDGFETARIDMEAMLDGAYYSGTHSPELPVMYEISGGDIATAKAFNKGYITVQDPASALVASFAEAARGDNIIDVCAAPGGKSLAIAELCGDSCRIEARDVSRQKTALIEENVKRCGYKNISVRVQDALKEDEESLYRADILIADLPCSGLGVIGKKPDIKLNLEEYSVAELQELQRDILRNVSRFVKPKGKLVYSTCTLSRAENEMNAAFAENELGFKKIAECKLLPGAHNDGFYIAVLQKKY